MNQLIHETFQLNGALLERGNEIAEPFGLTSARWQVLSAIELEGRALTVSQVARRMGLARQSVQRVINDLTDLEMVTSGENVDHKRAPLISLTTQGADALQRVESAQMRVVNQIAEAFTARQLTTTLRVLEEMKRRVTDVPIGD